MVKVVVKKLEKIPTWGWCISTKIRKKSYYDCMFN